MDRKRQRARLALDVVDERVGQLRLHPQAHAAALSSTTDAARGLHGSDQHVVRTQQLGDLRVGRETPVEIRAQRHHYECRPAGSRPREQASQRRRRARWRSGRR